MVMICLSSFQGEMDKYHTAILLTSLSCGVSLFYKAVHGSGQGTYGDICLLYTSALETMIQNMFHKDCATCTDQEVYEALLTYTKEQLAAKGYHDGKKKIYYISAEFLIGKLLSNNLINLGIYDEVAEFLKKNGKSLAEIESVEPEPSLGNGGLGRLAACFLDSIATLGLPGEGIGLNYHLGLFKQVFEDNLQHEVPNPWITPDS